MTKISSDFSSRLKDIVVKNGGNATFSQKTEINLRTLNYYLAGKSKPNIEALQKISTVADVSVDWLIFGESKAFDNIRSMPKHNNVSYAPLGILDFSFSQCDTKTVLREGFSDVIYIREDILWDKYHLRPDDAALIEMPDDSMDPVFRVGEMLLVNISETTYKLRDGVLLFKLGENVFIKRVQCIDSKRIKIISENPAYEDYFIEHKDQQIDILGRVVGHIKVV